MYNATIKYEEKGVAKKATLRGTLKEIQAKATALHTGSRRVVLITAVKR